MQTISQTLIASKKARAARVLLMRFQRWLERDETRTASHSAQKDGRRAKRDTADISYHCLRHSFISMLRTTGGNQAVAKELAGHSSDLVNDDYTHLPPEVLAKAVNALPTIEVK